VFFFFFEVEMVCLHMKTRRNAQEYKRDCTHEASIPSFFIEEKKRKPTVSACDRETTGDTDHDRSSTRATPEDSNRTKAKRSTNRW